MKAILTCIEELERKRDKLTEIIEGLRSVLNGEVRMPEATPPRQPRQRQPLAIVDGTGLSDKQVKVLAQLKTGPSSVPNLSERTGLNLKTTWSVVNRLMKLGKVVRLSRALYALPDATLAPTGANAGKRETAATPSTLPTPSRRQVAEKADDSEVTSHRPTLPTPPGRQPAQEANGVEVTSHHPTPPTPPVLPGKPEPMRPLASDHRRNREPSLLETYIAEFVAQALGQWFTAVEIQKAICAAHPDAESRIPDFAMQLRARLMGAVEQNWLESRGAGAGRWFRRTPCTRAPSPAQDGPAVAVPRELDPE